MKDSIPSQVIKNRRLCFSLGKNDFKNKFDYIFYNNYDIESENKLINLIYKLLKNK